MQKIRFQKWDCVLTKEEFANGGYCLELHDVKTGEPIATLNRWLPGLKRNEIALDVNNCGKELPELLIAEKVIEPTRIRSIESGYCSYPVYRLKQPSQ